MLVLEMVAKIQRGYFVQKKTIKAICRELRDFTEGRSEDHAIRNDP